LPDINNIQQEFFSMKIRHLCIALALASGMSQVAIADTAAAEARFKQLCASCHGVGGKGDGPAAAGLRPRPADMTTSQWQASVDDDYLRDIISKGGAAVGKSPMMTPWGHVLRGEELDNMVQFIRSLGD
jgi:mono/diheme cytochrome c family protein